MKLFLTGATGFIGGAVTRMAISARHRVTALVRSETSGPADVLSKIGVALHVGDLREPQSFTAAGAAEAVDQGMNGQFARQFLAWKARRPGVLTDLPSQTHGGVHR